MIKRLALLFKSVYSKYFLVLLTLIVITSYGQMLRMTVYQDDNAIFFKLAHLKDKAGFLGTGPFGEGAYKYTVTPYIPLYYLFGYNTTVYYALALAVYLLATICVYKIFSRVLGNIAGRISALLYAGGYVASDGFIRLYNTITTSFTVIAASLILLGYWGLYQQQSDGRPIKTLGWYLLALASFVLALEFGFSRTHYLISAVVLFEIVFLTFRAPLKSIVFSLIRLIPFVYLHYRYFISGADPRTGQIGELAKALLKGELFQSFGFITTLANLFLPDWAVNLLATGENQAYFLLHTNYLRMVNLFATLAIVVIVLLLRNSRRLLVAPLLMIVIVAWGFGVKRVFEAPALVLPEFSALTEKQITLATVGGFLIILLPLIALAIREVERRKMFIFLLGWVLLNIGAYSTYMPLVTYETTNRYLAHSFLPLVGLWGLLVIAVRPGILRSAAILVVVIWGTGNLASSMLLQHEIVKSRSEPTRKFYQQLRQFVPQIHHGDLFYFDVAEGSVRNLDDALMVSQMPDTAAIAWRYGVDRQDFQKVATFAELVEVLNETKVPLSSIRTFFYDHQLLIDTTDQTTRMLTTPAIPQEVITSILALPTTTEKDLKGTLIKPGEWIVNFTQPLSSVTPLDVELEITAAPLLNSSWQFPLLRVSNWSGGKLSSDELNLTLDYLNYKKDFAKTTQVSASSEWREKVAANLLDNDSGSSWQADRITWKDSPAVITLDLGSLQSVDRLVWTAGYVNNTPTAYSLKISEDEKKWQVVSQVREVKRGESGELRVIRFPSIKTRYVRMVITETLTGDSPMISEIWVVPTRYSGLELKKAENLLTELFDYVPSEEAYKDRLNYLGYQGSVKVSWKSNKSDKWITTEKSSLEVVYDGNPHRYKLRIPAGGTRLEALKLSPTVIPGDPHVQKVVIKYPTLPEMGGV